MSRFMLSRILITALLALGLFGGNAQAEARVDAEQIHINDKDGDVPLPLAGAARSMPPVRKLSDSDLNCAQIHAETQGLEKTASEQQATALHARQAMEKAQIEMTQLGSQARGGGMAGGIASGLIGMIPGASQVQGHAMQAAANARRTQMQEYVDRMMQAQTQLMAVEQTLEYTHARIDHLAGLFLQKGCRLSRHAGQLPPS